MAKKVVVTMTVAQAMALRDLAGEGWAGHEGAMEKCDGLTPVMGRAMGALEDAIEASTGNEFVFRHGPRKEAGRENPGN